MNNYVVYTVHSTEHL